MNIGENIKLIRRTKGVTQEQLATALGYTKSFMSLVESGDRSLGESDLLRVANALSVSVDKLRSKVTVHFRSDAPISSELSQIEQAFILHARNQRDKKI